MEVEDWVRRNWLTPHFGLKFSRERLPLRSGGMFDFDAVSDDRSVVATISTNGAKTSGGKHGMGKMLKLEKVLLEREPDIEVVGEAEDESAAAKLIESLRPHVVLTDFSVRPTGKSLAKQVKSQNPGTKVLGVTETGRQP